MARRPDVDWAGVTDARNAQSIGVYDSTKWFPAGAVLGLQ